MKPSLKNIFSAHFAGNFINNNKMVLIPVDDVREGGFGAQLHEGDFHAKCAKSNTFGRMAKYSTPHSLDHEYYFLS